MKSSNTRPEIKLQQALLLRSEVFETHVRRLRGTPDIFLERDNLVIFVHGCYWHSHKDCAKSARHSTSNPFLNLIRNGGVARDVSIVRELRGSGFEVFIAWECHINKSVGSVVDKIQRLKQRKPN
jgi:DNA mismatch endonuclease, patch repair protein